MAFWVPVDQARALFDLRAQELQDHDCMAKATKFADEQFLGTTKNVYTWNAMNEPSVFDSPQATNFADHQYTGTTKDVYTWNDMNEPSVFNGQEASVAARIEDDYPVAFNFDENEATCADEPCGVLVLQQIASQETETLLEDGDEVLDLRHVELLTERCPECGLETAFYEAMAAEWEAYRQASFIGVYQ